MKLPKQNQHPRGRPTRCVFKNSSPKSAGSIGALQGQQHSHCWAGWLGKSLLFRAVLSPPYQVVSLSQKALLTIISSVKTPPDSPCEAVPRLSALQPVTQQQSISQLSASLPGVAMRTRQSAWQVIDTLNASKETERARKTQR